MSSLTEAIEIAARVHRGQTDKAGEEYIMHVLEVMRMCKGDREAQIVAVLHDVIEDGPTGIEKIALLDELQSKFSDRIYEALLCLTHDPEEPYEDYIERVATNYLARKVKCKDLVNNMDPRRIPAHQIVDKDFRRWDRYRRALIRLERHD